MSADKEKGHVVVAESISLNSSDHSQGKSGFFKDFVDSFRQARVEGVDAEGLSYEQINDLLTAKAPLKRSLNGAQISLIAIGGSIGSGLFVGSGNSFHSGGPAAVIIGFALMGYMIFCTMQSVGALATHYPVSGSYLHFSSRFISKSMGCALAWTYFQNWLCAVPLELISAAITISYWDSDNNGATNVNKVAWVSLFYAFIFFINLFGAAGYGWAEAILSIVKVLTIIGFCIFAIVTICGGYPKEFYGPTPTYGPGHKYIGGYFWQHPGAFKSGFKSVISVLINAAFSYGGSELAALAAAETKDPGRTLPRAIKQVFWRILLFYIISLALVGCLVPYTDSRLGVTQDGRASPFVIAISNAGVKGLPSVFNVVILLSVISVGNAGVYASSRTAPSLAAQGFAPRWFGYIDRKGRPLVGIIISAIFGLLCFLAAYKNYGEVFNWILSLSSMSSLFIWGCMNLSMFRCYQALYAQGRSSDELLFKPIGGWFTPLIGFVLNMVVICLQFWTAVWPLGGKPSASAFFQTYLSVPILIVVYAASRIYFREKKWFHSASEIDLDTGLRDDIDTLRAQVYEENQRIRSKGWVYRVYRFWC